MENISIQAQSRTVNGSKGATEVRRAGSVPAIIYGGEEPVAVSVSMHELRHAIYTPSFHVLSLDVDGSPIRCIVKDVQFHPVTDEVVHVDFLRLVDGQKVKVEVPLKFVGVSVGIKAGGKLIQKVRKVKIKAMPEALVDELTLDVTELKLGNSLRIRDINPGDGIEILNSPGIPVVTIEIPRALKSAESEAAKVGATASAEGEEEGAEPAESAEE